ncbi:hypothetical protein ACJ41O_012827 [Fusarium nematophilum]
MATPQRPARPRNPRHVLDDAIDNNSISQLAEALQLAKSNPPRNSSYETFLSSALSSAVQDGKLDLVRYLLEQESAPMTLLSPILVWGSFSIPLLELLMAHGWDINRSAERGANSRCRRLVDMACHDQKIMTWLVDHGARVDGGEDNYEVFPEPAPLLETCASSGSVSTFKFLQARGARLGRRTLHRAAGGAAALGVDPNNLEGLVCEKSDSTDDKASSLAKHKKERGEMLRFLIEELNLDINAMDTDVQRAYHWGTPLCYVATKQNGEAVARWLLAKGADPNIENIEGADAERVAQDHGSEKVVAVLQDWKKTHGLCG